MDSGLAPLVHDDDVHAAPFGVIRYAHVFGALFRLWPAMKQGTRAAAQFWVTVIGVAGVIVGSMQQVQNGSIVVHATGLAVIIAGTLLLGWLFWERARV